MKSVASSMGMKTVLNGPIWSCTSLMQVNCRAHIRLQANKADQESRDFFMKGLIELNYHKRIK
jgi:hypothetical protein